MRLTAIIYDKHQNMDNQNHLIVFSALFLKLLPLGDYTYETLLCVYTLAVKLKHQS